MSVLMFPEPQDWRSGQRKSGWAIVGLLVICGWVVYSGAEATLRGHYLTTAVVVGWVAPLLTALAALALFARGRISLRANFDATGTTIKPDLRISVLLLVGFVVFIPAGALYAVFVPLGAIDLSMSRGMQIFSPILMASAVVIALIGLIMAWRRGGMGYLKLTESGVDYANIASTKSIPWESVVAVQGHSEAKKTRKALVLCMGDGTEEVVDGLDLYVPNGVGLYWMVRHYWRHADDRAELADGRALERLRDGRFDLA
jgi:hypothetical protein